MPIGHVLLSSGKQRGRTPLEVTYLRALGKSEFDEGLIFLGAQPQAMMINQAGLLTWCSPAP